MSSLFAAAWSFAGVAAVVTITPGLDTALVLRSALTRCRREAFATALGIGSGVLVWAVAAAIGVSSLLTASKAAYTALKLVGALYVVVMGARLLWRAVIDGRGSADNAPTAHAVALVTSPWSAFRAGLLTNLLNPKVGVFYVALLPQFIPEGMSPVGIGILFGVVHHVESLLWFSLIILCAGSARHWLAHRRAQRIIDGAAGLVLVGFGVKLARAGHP